MEDDPAPGREDSLERLRRMRRELLQVLDECFGPSVPSSRRHDGGPQVSRYPSSLDQSKVDHRPTAEGSYDSARTLQRPGEAREYEQLGETRESEGAGTGTTGRSGQTAECRFSGKRAALEGKAELGLKYGNTGIWEHTDEGVEALTGGTNMNAKIAGIDVSIPVPRSAFCAWERRVPRTFLSTQGARPMTWGGCRGMEVDTVVAATASAIASSARVASPKTLGVRSGVRVDRSVALSPHPDRSSTQAPGVARGMSTEFGTVQPCYTAPNHLAARFPPPTPDEVASAPGCEDATEKDSTFDEKVPEEHLRWRAARSEEDQARPRTSRGLQPASASPGCEGSLERVRRMRRELLQVLDECCGPSVPSSSRHDGGPQVGVRPTVEDSGGSLRTLRCLYCLRGAGDVERPEDGD